MKAKSNIVIRNRDKPTCIYAGLRLLRRTRKNCSQVGDLVRELKFLKAHMLTVLNSKTEYLIYLFADIKQGCMAEGYSFQRAFVSLWGE